MNITENKEVQDLPVWLARRINDAGIDLIKEFEGLRLKPYRCSSNVWTIGYGHTRTVRLDMVITPGQAEQLLREDLRVAEKAVVRFVQVPLSNHQFSALVSFVFNVGVGNFEKSTLLRLLNRGWYEQVPAQFARWNRSRGEILGGLARRRAAEARLWNTPDNPISFPEILGEA
ncbi:MAG TPA: muraminidase [Rhodospirillaceae bacterium]|nr:muraminidase [Rhodospirillaceae bacterium]